MNDINSTLNIPSKNYQITIAESALNIDSLVKQIHANQGESGAVVTFTGAVRVSHEESGLTGMSLEHYPGMTEKQLESILIEANQRWLLNKILVVHRVGYLNPGDPIVFIGTCALHRKEAFEAAEFIMDYLKQKATFWKKEHYGLKGDKAHKGVWVEAKDTDNLAASRWL